MSPASRETPRPTLRDWTEVAIGAQMLGLYLASAAFIQQLAAGALADFVLAGVGFWVAWLGCQMRTWKVVAFGLTAPLLFGAVVVALWSQSNVLRLGPQNSPQELTLPATQALLTMPLFALGFQTLDALRFSGGASRPLARWQFPISVLMWMTLTVACVFGLSRSYGASGLAIGSLIGHAVFVGWLAARFRAAA